MVSLSIRYLDIPYLGSRRMEFSAIHQCPAVNSLYSDKTTSEASQKLVEVRSRTRRPIKSINTFFQLILTSMGNLLPDLSKEFLRNHIP